MRRQLNGPLVAAFALALGLSGPADAICIVTLVDATGGLGLSPDYETLSSQNAGGVPASFTVLTVGVLTTHQLVVDAPTSFASAPPGGDANVTFSATLSMTGATILGQVLAGLNYPLGLGLTTVTVHTSAEKTSGIFPAGSYELEVDARCI